MRRWLIVLALAGCRDKAAPAPAPAPPAAAPQAVKPAPSPPSAPTPMPTLPSLDGGIDPRGLPPAQSFAAEHEDRVWKAATEKMLRERLAKLPGGAPPLECKQTICQLTFAASGSALDQLQQLQDVAQNVVLTREGDTIRAYLRFDRAPD